MYWRLASSRAKFEGFLFVTFCLFIELNEIFKQRLTPYSYFLVDYRSNAFM